MSKKKRGNYNQDYFKVGGSPQPGDDIVQERQKRRLAGQKPEQPRPAREDEPAIPEDEG
ncbi:MAG TPA: hypothetical protein VFG66_05425 [Gemmatimonadales bacterium]|nr:hypothetical protein [Gemmatimonadales bacterium]